MYTPTHTIGRNRMLHSLQSTDLSFIISDGTSLFEKIALLWALFLWLPEKAFEMSNCPSHLKSRPFFTSWPGMLGCATIIDPEMYKWLIFMRTSTTGVYRGIWKPQPLFSASLHQSIWVYLLTISWCFDISLMICLMNECLMTHLRSEVTSQWAKGWLLLLPWAIPAHFCTE